MANGHGFHIGLPYNDHDTWSVLQNEALSMLCPGQTTVFSALRWVEQNVERKKWRKVESASNDKNGGRLGLPLKLGQIYHGWGRIFWDNPGVDTPPTPWSKPVDQTWQWSLGSLPHLLNVTFLKRGIQKILHHGPWVGVHRSMFFLLDTHAIFAALKIALSENIPDPIIEARLMGVSWCFWSPELCFGFMGVLLEVSIQVSCDNIPRISGVSQKLVNPSFWDKPILSVLFCSDIRTVVVVDVLHL